MLTVFFLWLDNQKVHIYRVKKGDEFQGLVFVDKTREVLRVILANFIRKYQKPWIKFAKMIRSTSGEPLLWIKTHRSFPGEPILLHGDKNFIPV